VGAFAANGVGKPTRHFYRYNPATDMWVSKRQAPHVHRAGAGVVMRGGNHGPNIDIANPSELYTP
jgi:hypothetical protein